MKYGWIAIVAMMATLFSAGQVTAQDPSGTDYGPEEIGPEEAVFSDPDTVPDDSRSELEKLQDLDAEASTSAAAARDRGMGSTEAERERMLRSVGTVGQTVRNKGDEAIPLKFQFHGYYRSRYNWIGNAPMPVGSIPSESAFPSKNASYGYMRLRLDPEVTYGPNPDLPIARLRFTIDGFDNVVFGDNARVFSTPLFAVDQSYTDVFGVDLRDSLKLERAWIEFLVPIGQVRVGRMESHWGMGALTHAGNGLAEWGDFYRGETFDRILFATRPITLARGISKGDTRQTPLIYAFVYDRLTQDPVVDPMISSNFERHWPELRPTRHFKPFYTTFDERSTFPLAYLTNLDRRVSEIVNVLAWNDEDFGRAATDEFFIGAYAVYRFQRSTDSRITIPDVAWRLKTHAQEEEQLGDHDGRRVLHHPRTQRRTGTFSGGCPPAPCNEGKGLINNVIARIGVMDEGAWKFDFEGGYASGDDNVLSLGENPATLKTRGFNENIKVGLLMYQVGLRALTYQALAPLGAADLGANGSVWNSKYFMPSFRFTMVNGLELHTQFLVAWANKLDPVVYGTGNQNDECGFEASASWAGRQTSPSVPEWAPKTSSGSTSRWA